MVFNLLVPLEWKKLALPGFPTPSFPVSVSFLSVSC